MVHNGLLYHLPTCNSRSNRTCAAECNCGAAQGRVNATVYYVNTDNVQAGDVCELREEIAKLKKENHALRQQVFAAQRNRKL